MKTGGSRERLIAMHSPKAFDSFTPAHRAASRWVVSGSRLLRELENSEAGGEFMNGD
ncbi:MAG: hypothetical protein JO077_18175 [Verrucomicrobia bacterium]|nr:hypothetical protein [Verrucomicrobiota bacterium]